MAQSFLEVAHRLLLIPDSQEAQDSSAAITKLKIRLGRTDNFIFKRDYIYIIFTDCLQLVAALLALLGKVEASQAEHSTALDITEVQGGLPLALSQIGGFSLGFSQICWVWWGWEFTSSHSLLPILF